MNGPGFTKVAILVAASALVMWPTTRGPMVSAAASQPQPGPAGSILQPVLQRAADWAASFSEEFSAVVAEEQFEQRLSGPPDAVRTMRSDFLLIRVPERNAWLPFRDVYEVAGRQVRDRDERLRKLFMDSPATALSDANRINQESSRYNLGAVVRTINVPTFALICLEPDYLPRFEFKKVAEGPIEGRTAWRVGFVERARRTIVKTLRGDDVRIEGSLWVDPESGHVVRTLVKTAGTQDPDKRPPPLGGSGTLMWVMVDFARDPQLGIWVPATMEEWAMAPDGRTVSGKATYSHFRRFDVSTSESFTPRQ